MLAGDKSAKRNSLMGRLSRSSVAPSETVEVEDVDATLGTSDAADVEEDDGGDDDADSDEDEVTSKAAGGRLGMGGLLARQCASRAACVFMTAANALDAYPSTD